MRANRGRFEVPPVRTIVAVRRENHIASYLEIISLAEEIKSVIKSIRLLRLSQFIENVKPEEGEAAFDRIANEKRRVGIKW
jgi:hypothetical protein